MIRDSGSRGECATFLGFRNVCGNIVAEFMSPIVDYDGLQTFVMNKKSCEARLDNLKNGGRPHEQTALALRHWPGKASGDGVG